MIKNNQQNSDSRQGRTFKEYYNLLGTKKVVAPKKMFVEEMAELCMVSTKTIRGYLAGTYQPDMLRKRLISEKLGIPEDELFPPRKESEEP